MQCRLKQIRKLREMTQSELAEKTGISVIFIDALENGAVKEINSKELIKIARALNATVEQIFLPEPFN